MKKETYTEARARLHRELGPRGWTLSSPTLKVLWAERGYGYDKHRVWFKAQAVYLDSHTLDFDPRGKTADDLISRVDRAITIRSKPIL